MVVKRLFASLSRQPRATRLVPTRIDRRLFNSDALNHGRQAEGDGLQEHTFPSRPGRYAGGTLQSRGTLGSLAEESQRVVALLKLEGYSNEEIARSLDCSSRTVERKLEVIRKRWTAEGTP